MKLNKNNKGLSLIELIIAIAIFAIAGIAICGFVSFCTRMYTHSTENTKLQYDQQIVVNKVKDTILETSRGLYFKDGKLIVFSENPDFPDASTERYAITQISFYKDTNELKLAGPIKLATVDKVSGIPASSEQLLSDCVTEFDVDTSKIDKGTVTVTLTFKVGEKEITVNPVITLRNVISLVDDTTDLSKDTYSKDKYEAKLYSPVDTITIVRVRGGEKEYFTTKKTDVIEIPGTGTTEDSVTVDYDAEVHIKPSYQGPTTGTVKWYIDESTVTAGYKDYIKIDENTGNVTVCTKKVGGKIHTPNEFFSGYFVIKAVSVDDEAIYPDDAAKRHTANLRIEVKTGGIYPVKITTDPSSINNGVNDILNGTLTYTFAHEINYTGLIEDPANPGHMVNPLKGEGVYKKITYSVTTDDGLPLPAGAGFSTGTVDGKFIVVKSMEKHTYTIRVTVNELDKNGEEVYDEFTLTIPEGAVQDSKDITVPVLSTQREHDRAAALSINAAWSRNIPVWYKDSRDTVGTQYKYYYEWTITKNDDPTWGNSAKNTFDNIYFSTGNASEGAPNKDGDGKSVQSDQNNRIKMIYCEPALDWGKTFTYKVELRALLVDPKSGKKLYYKLPTKSDLSDVTTNNKNEAYVSSSIITINPVSIILSPIEVKYYRNNQRAQGEFYSIFNTSDKIGIGYNYTGSDWNKRQEKGDYYKSFKPAFTGLDCTIFNYKYIFGKRVVVNPYYSYYEYSDEGAVKSMVSTKDAALRLYNLSTSGTVNEWNPSSGYTGSIKANLDLDNKLYICLKMTPSNWVDVNKMPAGAKWTCIMQDGHDNSVRAKFQYVKDGKTITTDVMNYEFYNKYEGKY